MIVHQRNHLLGGIFVFRCHVPIEQVFNIAKRYRMVAQAEPGCVLFRKGEHEITETDLDDLLLVCINPVLIAHFCLGCGRGPKSIAVHLPYPLLLRTARLVGPLTVQRRVVWRQEDAARMPGRSFRLSVPVNWAICAGSRGNAHFPVADRQHREDLCRLPVDRLGDAAYPEGSHEAGCH